MRIAESLDYGATLGLATTVAERLPSVRASNRHHLLAAKLTKFAASGWSDSSPAKPFGPFLACCFDELRPFCSRDETPRNFSVQGLQSSSRETRTRRRSAKY